MNAVCQNISSTISIHFVERNGFEVDLCPRAFPNIVGFNCIVRRMLMSDLIDLLAYWVVWMFGIIYNLIELKELSVESSLEFFVRTATDFDFETLKYVIA